MGIERHQPDSLSTVFFRTDSPDQSKSYASITGQRAQKKVEQAYVRSRTAEEDFKTQSVLKVPKNLVFPIKA